MEAMIFCAGLGTRMQPITNHQPKALVKVNGVTLLERNILKMISHGITKIIINVHHYPDLIIDFLKQKNFDCEIIISDERNELLDTGGGLMKAKKYFSLKDNILLHNVDILSDLDFNLLEQYHNSLNTSIATLAVRNRETKRYLLFNEENILVGWKNIATKEEKIKRMSSKQIPFAFSGIQIVSKDIFNLNSLNGKFSLTDMYLSLAEENNIYSYCHNEGKWIDVGNPLLIKKAEEMFEK